MRLQILGETHRNAYAGDVRIVRKARRLEEDPVQAYAVDVDFFEDRMERLLSTVITGGKFFDFGQGVWFDKEEARKVVRESQFLEQAIDQLKD
jgi:hypothetical protein